MRHLAGPRFWQCYGSLPEKVRRLADKSFALLKRNPAHPSLRLGCDVRMRMLPLIVCSALGFAVGTETAGAAAGRADGPPMRLRVRATWGHGSPAGTAFAVRIAAEQADLAEAKGIGLEADDGLREGTWQTRSGGGDDDGVEFTLLCPKTPVKVLDKPHSIWAALIQQSEQGERGERGERGEPTKAGERSGVDTARRLRADAAWRIDPRKLTVALDRPGGLAAAAGEAGAKGENQACECEKGFSVTVDQLVRNDGLWVPSLDVYLTAADPPVAFEDHQKAVAPRKGLRVLDQVAREPEATYAQYAARWEDMGSPAYVNPHQPAPGHIVGLTWDSAIHKFGIDRGAGVWNDYGNPDRFRFWLDFSDTGDPSGDMRRAWKGQALDDGLPILTTTLERDGLRYQVEQFAWPLDGPPTERRGDMPMVLLQKVRVENLGREARTVSVTINHRRDSAGAGAAQAEHSRRGDAFVFQETAGHKALFAVRGAGLAVTSCQTISPPPAADRKGDKGDKAPTLLVCKVAVRLSLAAGATGATGEFVVALPSPPAPPDRHDALAGLDYAAARAATRKFWSDYIARGAQFRVPEKVVNDLFRASLWHALRLPRRHGSSGPGVRIDLPYSNFAYDQNGTPWPVNQAVYVDYMIYGLRGYDDIALEELLTIYRNNQRPDGRVAGYANWGVYTPSMIYAAARNFLLSQDRASFEKLLPQTLKALDWCLKELRAASDRPGLTKGLLRAPLNDLTGEGIWAFNQAYLYAALDALGQALDRIGHGRAGECRAAARSLRQDINRALAAASVRSALVQLRDHTWTPYVPCEVTTPRRLLELWYPTDVDTGAVHLLRLKALPADGPLADSLLHDHEDNLYLHGRGMANEPVYNQQATAYLLRDDAKAAIRAFYSYMACAFSHSALEPVEHRWAWGQYFGPPSTDGAWFDLYRHMLIHERDDDSLLLLQAAPRGWLEDGKRIEIERAPTHYGRISLTASSQAAAGWIWADVDLPAERRPRALYLRLRHPAGKPMKSVTVDGRDWADFDTRKEWVTLRDPAAGRHHIVVAY